MDRPRLEIASVVTPEQGDRFTEEWLRHTVDDREAYEAFDVLRLINWPGDDEDEAQSRYDRIVAEIFDKVFHSEEVTAAISRTFVRVATDVLRRERDVQK